MKRLALLFILFWVIRLNTGIALDTYYNNCGDTKIEFYGTIYADDISIMVAGGIMTVKLGEQMPKVKLRKFYLPVNNISYYFYHSGGKS